MIKVIALDLDGTTLTHDKKLTVRTQRAIEAAIKKGVSVVIATGRVFSALPEEILRVDGIQYALTSNGACITDLQGGKLIYTNCIDPSALVKTAELIQRHAYIYDYMVEVFSEGHAYIEKRHYENVQSYGLGQTHVDYILKTREPVIDLFGFMLAHKDTIENINVNFVNMDDRAAMWPVMRQLENVTLTSSFDHNIEVGGMTTSKAEAISRLCGILGCEMADVMACGDSPNDIQMLRAAGFPVAMGNAKNELKEIAAYVAPANDEDGVADAIEKFVL